MHTYPDNCCIRSFVFNLPFALTQLDTYYSRRLLLKNIIKKKKKKKKKKRGQCDVSANILTIKQIKVREIEILGFNKLYLNYVIS